MTGRTNETKGNGELAAIANRHDRAGPLLQALLDVLAVDPIGVINQFKRSAAQQPVALIAERRWDFKPKLRERIRRGYDRQLHPRPQSQIDWMFLTADAAVAVEVKIGSSQRFEPEQLLRCSRALTRHPDLKGRRLKGIIVFANEEPYPVDLRQIEQGATLLGVARWTAVMQVLTDLAPDEADDHNGWVRLLTNTSP